MHMPLRAALCVACLLTLTGRPAASGPASSVGLGEGLSQDLTRIFASSELNGRGFGPARWMDDAAGAYLTVEASASNPAAREIVRYEAASGSRAVLIGAAALTPSGTNAPLRIENYTF
jgi:dipeptidyl-peptidase-4